MDTTCGQSELKLSPKGTKRANVVPKCHRKFDSWKRGPRTLTPGRSSPPFGTQLGAKGLPKSSFLAPSRPKINKNDVQGRVSEKGWNFDWNLFGKCRFLNVLNQCICKQRNVLHWRIIPKICLNKVSIIPNICLKKRFSMHWKSFETKCEI